MKQTNIPKNIMIRIIRYYDDTSYFFFCDIQHCRLTELFKLMQDDSEWILPYPQTLIYT